MALIIDLTDDPAPSDPPGLSERTAAAHATDDRHPRTLLAIACVEFCLRFTELAWRLMLSLTGTPPSGAEGRLFLTSDTALATTQAMSVLFALAVLSGGVLGDRFLGHRRAITFGIGTIAAGVLLTLVRMEAASYAALALLFMGTGLAKASNLFILATHYGRDNPRRVAGFAIYEAAGTAGFFLGLLMCNAVIDTTFWPVTVVVHIAVAALALFMVGTYPGATQERWRDHLESRVWRPPWRVLGVFGLGSLLVSLLVGVGSWYLGSSFEMRTRLFVLPVIVAGFCYWVGRQRWTVVERRHLRGIGVLFGCVAIISVLSAISNPEDERFRSNPADYLTGALPDYIPSGLIFPLAADISFVLLWTWLARRRIQPRPAPVLAIGALLLGFGFFIHTFAASAVPSGVEPVFVLPRLLRIIVLSVIGPVLLASVTRLLPLGIGASILGIWPLASQLGDLIGTEISVPPNLLALSGMLACVAAALVFAYKDPQITRLETDNPVPAQRPRWRSRLGYASAALVVLAAVRLGTVVYGASSPTVLRTVFHGADLAHLPNEANLGFIDFASLPDQPIGAIDDDRLASRDERPLRGITIPRFLIGRYEVTVAQYGVCVDDGWCRPSDPRARDGSPEMPVRYVSWHEAREYCAWLQQKKILDTRVGVPASDRDQIRLVTLPTEAQWERAARTLLFTSLSALQDPKQVNYARSGRLGPVPVGQFRTATSDLQDLTGNVAEWTNSEYRAYPYDPNDGREDTSNATASRVIRGGSFYDDVSLLRPSARRAADPTRGYDFVGFRVAIQLTPLGASPAPITSTPPASTAAHSATPVR